MVRHEDGPVQAADTAPACQESSMQPPCYLPEKSNPYPLCIGRGLRICAHCCLWANYDPSEDERRVNQPLPLALLREMDGQPAWWECGPKNSGWGIISVDSGGYWKGVPLFCGRWREVNFEYDIEKRGMQIFHHPPAWDDMDAVTSHGEYGASAPNPLHYLRLRWMACYMLLVDDRSMRAHQAFLASDEARHRAVQSCLSPKGVALSDGIKYTREYNRLLAVEIEKFISDFAKDASERIDFEVSVAEKVTELAHLYI